MTRLDETHRLALDRAEGLTATPKNIDRVGAETSPEAARWAFGQWQLRLRGAAKFERASEMLFVREALEQSTHEKLAEYHASCFPSGVSVLDVTAGIGGDMIALAKRGPVRGYEIDSERAQCARHNLAVHRVEGEVVERDCLVEPWDADCIFADPARRVEGRRTLDPSEFSPPLDQLAARMSLVRLGGIKLSPLLRDELLESFGGRLEFVSFGGECREALVWLGSESGQGKWAVQVESRSRLRGSSVPPRVERPGQMLFAADPAAIRAHALGALCDEYGLAGLGSSNGFLTPVSAETFAAATPWLRTWHVVEHLPFDVKRIRATLRVYGLRVDTVKPRGVRVDPPKLVKELDLGFGKPATLALYPSAEGVRAVILAEISPTNKLP